MLSLPYLLSQAYSVAWGVAQRTVPLNGLRKFIVLLPPNSEQKVIVEKVEKLISLCDQLEAQFNQNKTYAEQLMQAELKEAFSHDLNPQFTVNILEEVGT